MTEKQSSMLRADNLFREIAGEIPVRLVDNVSLDIAAGEFVCIMGPSGSGKSSLLYLLGLLDIPNRGQIWLDGIDTSHFNEDQLAEHRLRYLGYVFQFHFLLAEFTVLDNVTLPMRKLGQLNAAAMLERAKSLLDKLGMLAQMHKYPHQLSGGQRQRVAIARALANDPKIILADEPTGNLDSASAVNVREILKNLAHDMGKTVIAVTHDIQFATAADTRIGLVDGRINADWFTRVNSAVIAP
ncbi:ABC transporter ATP-binding protein [Chitinibacter bivalviorum]|uniref:ABC transporter ATP-binding protein n=1 Tax=Chitinibacter bivalviorum TaxID=2739434 RepID=A0A7H9BI06_9NEIS|nr:ABC transporter ATP-binding protein [Chitinibacter bivalviorum]QLG87906.1 ABC transporter ATP-binding protein [Chitinibacter bivalviorum]